MVGNGVRACWASREGVSGCGDSTSNSVAVGTTALLEHKGRERPGVGLLGEVGARSGRDLAAEEGALTSSCKSVVLITVS